MPMRWLSSFVLSSVVALAASDQAADKEKDSVKDESTVKVAPARRIRLAGISVGAGFSHYSAPYYYGRPMGYYSPYWYPGYFGYDPYFYHPYYTTGFSRGPGMGEIRLRTGAKTAEVFIDGAYAGAAGDLKTLWLDPGAYNLEVRSNNESFKRRIYVLSGKTLRIDAKLRPAAGEEKP